MNVPRDVILDLLPLYMSGEASPATRAFVEQALAADPELAARVRSGWEKDLAAGLAMAPPPDLELKSIRKTRRILSLQKWIFGLAIAFTAAALAIEIPVRDGRISGVHFAFQDHPVPLGISALVAVILWMVYFLLKRRLRTTL